MRALIATGSGRYADPWHPYAATSPLIADILAERGYEVDIDDDVDAAMRGLEAVDLLVVNAGDPWRDGERAPVPEASTTGLRTALERGIGLVAVHLAVASLRDYPEWAGAIGGMWVPGGSYHPPIGAARITGSASTELSIDDFETVDERYCHLQRIGRSTVVATHRDEDGLVEPTAWVRTAGDARAAVTLLGHDERAYEAAGPRRLLGELADWAARANEPAPV